MSGSTAMSSLEQWITKNQLKTRKEKKVIVFSFSGWLSQQWNIYVTTLTKTGCVGAVQKGLEW